MSDLATQEREKYSDMWTVDAYGEHSPGEKYVSVFMEMISATRPPETDYKAIVLDAGCGSGKGALELHRNGFSVRCCDFTNEGLVPQAKKFPFQQVCLWNDLRVQGAANGWEKFDYVYCCDVMEHIPVALTMLVAARLLEVTKRAAFFSISFQPDVMGYWIGKPLHETVMPFVWWRDQFNAIGRVTSGRDLLGAGVFLVEPR